MRRRLLSLALAGVFGLIAAADAKACHKKSCAPACPPPAPCVVVVQPCPPPPPCPPPVHCAPAPKCGLLANLCKRPAPVHCAPVVYAAPAPVYYSAPAPVYATGQVYASGQ
jgi:hypothetical protein